MTAWSFDSFDEGFLSDSRETCTIPNQEETNSRIQALFFITNIIHSFFNAEGLSMYYVMSDHFSEGFNLHFKYTEQFEKTPHNEVSSQLLIVSLDLSQYID
jgi:hypothetical protein